VDTLIKENTKTPPHLQTEAEKPKPSTIPESRSQKPTKHSTTHNNKKRKTPFPTNYLIPLRGQTVGLQLIHFFFQN